MKSLSIRQQLAVIVGLSLLPVALLGYLFVAQSNKEIAFAQKEDRGVTYIEALLPDLSALAGGETRLSTNAALVAARTQFDGEMESAEVSQRFFEMREAGGEDARAAATALLSRIGDTSNLILDPDLDSYYVMDILVLKLPAAINAAADLENAFQAGLGSGATQETVRVDLLARMRTFQSLISGTGSSLAAAIDGNADGGVEPALTPAFAAYEAAASSYIAAVETALAAYTEAPGDADLAGVRRAEAQFATAALDYGKVVGRELSRLLEKRVAGFQTRLWTLLATSIGLVALVFGYSVLAANGIVKALFRLEGNIRGLADDTEAGSDIAGTDGKDEASAISRAVAYLRDQTVARQQQEAEARMAEQTALDDERRAAEAERASEAEKKVAQAVEQGKAVAALKQALVGLAQGDLESRIDRAFPADMDEVRVVFNETVEQFAQIVRQLRDTSGAIKSATGEILAGANDLSERTTRQATTIEQTSAAMEQLAHTVRANAEKAQEASRDTAEVSVVAEEGGTVMAQATQAMERITDSSAKISNIIGMIDDIAFQTNLLALNASVEAARAGEAGNGFAVVAVEVRRLAQSAADASSDVKTLIEQSAKEVDVGSKLVEDAAHKLERVLESVKNNGTLIGGISEASREQAAGISEVMTAVQQIDEMTQHNAALVEETNAAIEQTEAQASELDRVVETFRVGQDDGVSVSHSSAANTRAAPAEAKEKPQKLAHAAGAYLSHGNAAIAEDWAEL